MNRRYFITSAVAVGAVAALSRLPIGSALLSRAGNPHDGEGNSNQGSSRAIKEASSKGFKKVTKTNAEWKNILTPEQYNVTREKGTERPFSSPLNDIHEQGIFECVACELPLFDSKAKFDSGTGWPSFYQPITQENVHEEVDNSLWETRTEVMCARCDAHLGHVFPDGPKPTGLRYCMNGVALKFVKDKKDS
jgi:peptide-methionine (R)-S-oxide reductase